MDYTLKIYEASRSGAKYGKEQETIRGITESQKVALEAVLNRHSIPHQFIFNNPYAQLRPNDPS